MNEFSCSYPCLTPCPDCPYAEKKTMHQPPLYIPPETKTKSTLLLLVEKEIVTLPANEMPKRHLNENAITIYG